MILIGLWPTLYKKPHEQDQYTQFRKTAKLALDIRS